MSESFDITSIDTMQPFVEKLARKKAHEWHFRDDVFNISLVRRLPGKNTMSLIPGPMVEIQLYWPNDPVILRVTVLPQLEFQLRSAFAAIKKHSMHRPFAVATHA